MAKAPFFLDYDIVIDEGTRDPYVREQWLGTIERLAPTLLRTDNFLPELVDFLPLPASLRHAVKEAILSKGKAREEMAKQGIMVGGRGRPVSQREIEANADKREAEAMRTQAQAIAITEGVKTERARALLEAYMKQMEIEAEQAKATQQSRDQHVSGASQEIMDALGLLTELRGQDMDAAERSNSGE